MTALIVEGKSSAPRVQKFKENRIKQGFKRAYIWVFDLENSKTQAKMRQEALALRQTDEMREWDEFALEQLENGWK